MGIPILNMGSETRDVSDGIEKIEFELTRAKIENLAAKNFWRLFLFQLRSSLAVEEGINKKMSEYNLIRNVIGRIE
ncbi:hypothetical protein [Bacillus sp. JJ1562]|uniref:hypothetical protein n=1 Tax=Bacillus sp. JJ1562 TaxID=3122960 RepID=UPI00300226A1